MPYPYDTPEELLKTAEDYFVRCGAWSSQEVAKDGLTFTQRIAVRAGAEGANKRNRSAECVPHGWALYGGFRDYDEFRDYKHRGPEWARVVSWVDNVLRKCAELELMTADRKNNRGPEILVGTFWGYSAKQIVDFRDGIQAIATAAMTELAAKIPLDDRPTAIESFRKTVRAVAGLK